MNKKNASKYSGRLLSKIYGEQTKLGHKHEPTEAIMSKNEWNELPYGLFMLKRYWISQTRYKLEDQMRIQEQDVHNLDM